MRRERSKILETMFTMGLLIYATIALSACATTHMSERDANIESSIRESSAFTTYLQTDNISINSQNGKVTLSGTVTDASHKFLAEDLAKSISGVKGVDNKLEPAGGSPQKDSDAWLGAKVKADLMTHPGLNPEKTDVFVSKGIITLRGQVDSKAQRDLTEEYTKKVKGVKDVVNDITIAGAAGNKPQASSQKIDDASITAQVNTALASNRSTSDLDATVETYYGIVSVQGIADNQAQKDLVTKIITDIAGVKGVNNELSIEEEAEAAVMTIQETPGKIQ